MGGDSGAGVNSRLSRTRAPSEVAMLLTRNSSNVTSLKPTKLLVEFGPLPPINVCGPPGSSVPPSKAVTSNVPGWLSTAKAAADTGRPNTMENVGTTGPNCTKFATQAVGSMWGVPEVWL